MKDESVKSDLERIDEMKDSEIDYSDIPALRRTFVKKATVVWPPPKLQSKKISGLNTTDNPSAKVDE